MKDCKTCESLYIHIVEGGGIKSSRQALALNPLILGRAKDKKKGQTRASNFIIIDINLYNL